MNQGSDIHLSDSILERSTSVKYLGIIIGKHLNYNFHIAQVGKNLSIQFWEITRIRHYVRETRASGVLYYFYKTGYWIWSLNIRLYFKEQMETWFSSTKKTMTTMLQSSLSFIYRDVYWNNYVNCIWLSCCWVPHFFRISVRSVLPTELFNSIYDRKESNVPSSKTQFNLFSLSHQSCSVSRNSLRYRVAELNVCLIKNGLGTVVSSIRIKRKTSKHVQHVGVKHQISKFVFQWEIAHHVLLLFRDRIPFCSGSPLIVLFTF